MRSHLKGLLTHLLNLGTIPIMNPASKLSAGIRLITASVLSSFLLGLANADSPVVSWERIEGIDPNPTVGVGGQTFILPDSSTSSPVGFPWSVTRGHARLIRTTDRLQFDVNGLSMGGSAGIGTTGAVTKVKGTVICVMPSPVIGPILVSDFAETDAVDLSKEGDAHFQGKLTTHFDCPDPGQIAFLLRIADASVPILINSWLAHGAARRIQ